ncbi:MAG: DUF4112 domain-containing protein [Geminicoccaceae bacterium]|nr:DUF4112 domain-containing protein [Geminicoccaceae bacterium]
MSQSNLSKTPGVHSDTVQRLVGLAGLLDDRFRVPGTNFRFGLDGLIGLVPGIGDTMTAAIGAYIVGEALRLGVRKRTLARMVGNIGLDWAVGIVPLVGDLLDFGFRSHRRNIHLLLAELHGQGKVERPIGIGGAVMQG